MLKKLISPLTQFKYFTFWVYMLTPRCCRFHICCNYFESSEKLFPLLITSPVPPLLDPIYYHIQVTRIIESFIMNHVYFSYCGYFHVREQFVQYKEEALKKNNNKPCWACPPTPIRLNSSFGNNSSPPTLRPYMDIR